MDYAINYIKNIISAKAGVILGILLLLATIFAYYKFAVFFNTVDKLKNDNSKLIKNNETLKKELTYEIRKKFRSSEINKYKEDLTKEVKEELYNNEDKELEYEILATDANDVNDTVNIITNDGL